MGAGYLGSLGRRLPFAYDLNYPNFATGRDDGQRQRAPSDRYKRVVQYLLG